MNTDTSILLTSLTALVGSVAALLTTFVAYRKMQAEGKVTASSDKRADRTANVDSTEKLTGVTLRLVDELEKQLDDCNRRLEDQAALKIQAGEYRLGIRRILASARELSVDIERSGECTCSRHALMVQSIIKELETLYNGSYTPMDGDTKPIA